MYLNHSTISALYALFESVASVCSRHQVGMVGRLFTRAILLSEKLPIAVQKKASYSSRLGFSKRPNRNSRFYTRKSRRFSKNRIAAGLRLSNAIE
jgi:hypothetical protein